jgi:hypothetical protein
MKYALGNMLNGAGSLNPDGLSLDLQFAADKTLTARKGPTPVFTRASTATFVGSNGLIQPVLFNGPRFDHDPVTLASKGLLIEESRTNSWTLSEALGAFPWSVTNTTTATSNNTTSPDGLTTAEKFTVGSTTQEYGFNRNTFSFVSGTAYSIGFFFKADQITRINIITNNQALLPINAIFNLTGSGSIVGTPIGTASIQRFPNGWYRCSVSATALLNGITSVRVAAVSGTSISYPGNSVDSFWAWGAQLEAGSFPTSYIPTTTASVVRSADVCSITGANFSEIWSGVDATMFFRGSRIANQAGQTNWDLSSGTSATSIASDRGATTERIVANAIAIISTAAFTTLTGYKIAAALKTMDYAVSFNGASAITSSSAFVLTLDRMTIGMSRTNAGQLNGWIHSIKFYKKRLPNAKLAQLTV